MVAMTRGGMGLPLPQSQAGNSPCLPLRYRLHEVVSAPRSSCDRMTQLRLERRRLITRLSRLRPRAACCISDLRRGLREAGDSTGQTTPFDETGANGRPRGSGSGTHPSADRDRRPRPSTRRSTVQNYILKNVTRNPPGEVCTHRLRHAPQASIEPALSDLGSAGADLPHDTLPIHLRYPDEGSAQTSAAVRATAYGYLPPAPRTTTARPPIMGRAASTRRAGGAIEPHSRWPHTLRADTTGYTG